MADRPDRDAVDAPEGGEPSGLRAASQLLERYAFADLDRIARFVAREIEARDPAVGAALAAALAPDPAEDETHAAPDVAPDVAPDAGTPASGEG